MASNLKHIKDKVINFEDTKLEKMGKQFEVLKQFYKSAENIKSYGIAILDDRFTGSTEAITNTDDVEIIAEILANFTTTYAVRNNIPFEDFLDIYFGHFEKFMKKFEENENSGGN